MARGLSALAGRVAAARPPGWEICDAARARIAAGSDLVMLGPGVPDLPSPPEAVEACAYAIALGRTRYPNAQGEPALRAAIAERQSLAFGHAVDPADVLVTAGAQAGILACLMALAGPGDGIAVVTPHYPAYASAIAAVGAELVPFPLAPAPDYALRDDAAPARSVSTVLLCNPHNPTGRVFRRGELDGLAAVCRDRDLWLVSDEVYACLAYDGRHVAAASLPGMAERTFTLGSFSKSHAMAGWRCGWIVTPPGLGARIQPVAACGSLGVPPFVQDAALAALRAGGATEAAFRAEYRHRRDVLIGGLSRVPGLRVAAPEGGLFALVDVSGTGHDGRSFAWRLLDAGVCVIPGEAFGAPGTVRVALAQPAERLRLACARIADAFAIAPRSPDVSDSAIASARTKEPRCHRAERSLPLS